MLEVLFTRAKSINMALAVKWNKLSGFHSHASFISTLNILHCLLYLFSCSLISLIGQEASFTFSPSQCNQGTTVQTKAKLLKIGHSVVLSKNKSNTMFVKHIQFVFSCSLMFNCGFTVALYISDLPPPLLGSPFLPVSWPYQLKIMYWLYVSDPSELQVQSNLASLLPSPLPNFNLVFCCMMSQFWPNQKCLISMCFL